MLKLSLLAKAISTIFLPPLVSLWLFLIFMFYLPVGTGVPPPLYSLFVGITFFTILPLLTLVLMARQHAPTFDVPQSSRFSSYLIVIGQYVIGMFIFYLVKATLFFVIGAIYICTTIALLMINVVWKISVHAAGISGPVTFCLYVFGFSIWTMLLIAFVILVLWARWQLQAHTFPQLVGGMLVASVIAYLVSYLYF